MRLFNNPGNTEQENIHTKENRWPVDNQNDSFPPQLDWMISRYLNSKLKNPVNIYIQFFCCMLNENDVRMTSYLQYLKTDLKRCSRILFIEKSLMFSNNSFLIKIQTNTKSRFFVNVFSMKICGRCSEKGAFIERRDFMRNDLNIKNKLTSFKSIVCIVQQSSQILPFATFCLISTNRFPFSSLMRLALWVCPPRSCLMVLCMVQWVFPLASNLDFFNSFLHKLNSFSWRNGCTNK